MDGLSKDFGTHDGSDVDVVGYKVCACARVIEGHARVLNGWTGCARERGTRRRRRRTGEARVGLVD